MKCRWIKHYHNHNHNNISIEKEKLWPHSRLTQFLVNAKILIIIIKMKMFSLNIQFNIIFWLRETTNFVTCERTERRRRRQIISEFFFLVIFLFLHSRHQEPTTKIHTNNTLNETKIVQALHYKERKKKKEEAKQK